MFSESSDEGDRHQGVDDDSGLEGSGGGGGSSGSASGGEVVDDDSGLEGSGGSSGGGSSGSASGDEGFDDDSGLEGSSGSASGDEGGWDAAYEMGELPLVPLRHAAVVEERAYELPDELPPLLWGGQPQTAGARGCGV
jgi:hypothetical protein